MKNYVELLNKEVRIITLVVFGNGRKIKTEYVGKLIENYNESITIQEKDNTSVRIRKNRIKRIEENNG